MGDIRIKRLYDIDQADGGVKVLVDRVWPRGVRKDDPRFDIWLKEAGPSNELRKWFAHKLERWEAFKPRYFRELDENQQALEPIYQLLRDGDILLVYTAKDQQRNQAAALKEYLLMGRPADKVTG